MDNLKKCSQCKKYKKLNCFSPEKRTKIGLQAECKDCKNEKSRKYWYKYHEKSLLRKREYRRKNKARVNKRSRERYRANIVERRKRHREYQKEYYKKHTKIIKARAKKYQKNNRPKILVRERRWKKNNPVYTQTLYLSSVNLVAFYHSFSNYPLPTMAVGFLMPNIPGILYPQQM